MESIRIIRKNDLVEKMEEIYKNIKDTIKDRDSLIKNIVEQLSNTFVTIYKWDIEEVEKFVKQKYVDLNIRLSLLEPHEKETINAEFDKNDVFSDCVKEMVGNENFAKIIENEFKDNKLRLEVKKFLKAFGINDILAEELSTSNLRNFYSNQIESIILKLSIITNEDGYYIENMDNAVFHMNLNLIYAILVFTFQHARNEFSDMMFTKTKPISYEKFFETVKQSFLKNQI